MPKQWMSNLIADAMLFIIYAWLGAWAFLILCVPFIALYYMALELFGDK